MIKIFDELRKEIDKLENEYKKTQTELYEKQEHKKFKVGDWVKGNGKIGIVGWIENKGMDISESDGYFGLDVKNGSLGFTAPCKRNEYELLSINEFKYYKHIHKICLEFTGEEIDRLLYTLSCRNKNTPADKLYNILNKIRSKNIKESK